MSENASSRNAISWNWFCQGLIHTVPQDSCSMSSCPVGNCMNLSLAKLSTMILSSWKRYISNTTVLKFKENLSIWLIWAKKKKLIDEKLSEEPLYWAKFKFKKKLILVDLEINNTYWLRIKVGKETYWKRFFGFLHTIF